jgi:sensor histidine kinase YesM
VQPVEAGGLIRVYGRGETDAIVITISNPIPGSTSGLTFSTRGQGMALGNIRNRLELAFDEHASLITSQTEEQFFAVLKLPNDPNINN